MQDWPSLTDVLNSSTEMEVLLCISLSREDILAPLASAPERSATGEQLEAPEDISDRARAMLGDDVLPYRPDSPSRLFELSRFGQGFADWKQTATVPPSDSLSQAALAELHQTSEKMGTVLQKLVQQQEYSPGQEPLLLNPMRLFEVIDNVRVLHARDALVSIAKRTSVGRYRRNDDSPIVLDPHVVLCIGSARGALDKIAILDSLAEIACRLCQDAVACRLRARAGGPWFTILYDTEHFPDRRTSLDNASKNGEAVDFDHDQLSDEELRTLCTRFSREDTFTHHFFCRSGSKKATKACSVFLTKFTERDRLSGEIHLPALTVELRGNEPDQNRCTLVTRDPSLFGNAGEIKELSNLYTSLKSAIERMHSRNKKKFDIKEFGNTNSEEFYYCPAFWNCPDDHVADLPPSAAEPASSWRIVLHALLLGKSDLENGPILDLCCCTPDQHPTVAQLPAAEVKGWQSCNLLLQCCDRSKHPPRTASLPYLRTGFTSASLTVKEVWRLSDVFDST